MVKLLLKKGALHVLNIFGLTPLNFATERGNVLIFSISQTKVLREQLILYLFVIGNTAAIELLKNVPRPSVRGKIMSLFNRPNPKH